MIHALVLDAGLILYQSDPPDGEIEGLNFLAVLEQGEALLLDTGYRENLDAALPDLERRGARPSRAVVSHYHPDHCGGLGLLEGREIWAHAAWRATAAAWREEDAPWPAAPTRLVSAPTELRLGNRRLEIHPLPGHTDDSLVVVIDGKWLYAADTLLLTNEGAPLLPSVHSRPVSRHLEALAWLEERVDLVFVPGHGRPLRERPERERDLRNRRRYLEAVSRSAGGMSLAEATAGCDPPFLGNWHEHNCR